MTAVSGLIEVLVADIHLDCSGLITTVLLWTKTSHTHKHPAQGADVLCGWENPGLLNCRGFSLWKSVDAYKGMRSLWMKFPSYSEGKNSFHEERSDVLVGLWESVGFCYIRECKFKGWWSRWHLCAVKTTLFDCDVPAALLNRLLGFLHSLLLSKPVK